MANIQFDERGQPGGILNDWPMPTGGLASAPAGRTRADDAEAQALAKQYHTPGHIANDYWAPDWRAVFADPSRWGASAASAAPFDINEWGQNWLRSGGRTLQDFQNYVSAHPLGPGYSLSGSKGDKVVGPNGQGWDAVIASGLGGNGASWSAFGSGGGMPQSSYAASYTDPSTANLEKYVNELIAQLKGSPYSQQQQEIMRTQALEPIERDRTAAHSRALNNLSARGLDPNSGIAQDLLRQVDQGFDTQRAQAQNQLAYNEIGQSRQNQNDALSLLQLLYQLPRNAQSDALAVLNGAPNYAGLANGYAQLGQLNAMNSANNGSWLGQLLAYLLR